MSCDLSRKKPSLQNRLKKALEKLKIANQSVREKEETIDMLNIIVENKKSELNILKEELIEQKMRKVLYAVHINLHVLYAILHIQVCEPCPDAPQNFKYEIDLERFIFQKVSDYNGQYLAPKPVLQLTMFRTPAQFITNTRVNDNNDTYLNTPGTTG